MVIWSNLQIDLQNQRTCSSFAGICLCCIMPRQWQRRKRAWDLSKHKLNMCHFYRSFFRYIDMDVGTCSNISKCLVASFHVYILTFRIDEYYWFAAWITTMIDGDISVSMWGLSMQYLLLEQHILNVTNLCRCYGQFVTLHLVCCIHNHFLKSFFG